MLYVEAFQNEARFIFTRPKADHEIVKYIVVGCWQLIQLNRSGVSSGCSAASFCVKMQVATTVPRAKVPQYIAGSLLEIYSSY